MNTLSVLTDFTTELVTTISPNFLKKNTQLWELLSKEKLCETATFIIICAFFNSALNAIHLVVTFIVESYQFCCSICMLGHHAGYKQQGTWSLQKEKMYVYYLKCIRRCIVMPGVKQCT